MAIEAITADTSVFLDAIKAMPATDNSKLPKAAALAADFLARRATA